MAKKPNELAKLDAPIGAVLSEVDRLSTEDLRRELAESLRLTAGHLLRLAAIVNILEQRGEDLADLRIGLINHLRRIAAGQLLPEVVVRFAGYPALLTQVGGLPLPDQRRLADGESVRLVVAAADGQTHLLADPLKLTAEQVRQVFGPGRLRDDQEQVLLLTSRAAGPKPKAVAVRRRVRADRERVGLLIGRNFAGREEIVEALAELAPPPLGGEREVSLLVKVSAEEHRHIKVRAAESGRTINDLVRDALRAAALV